MKILKIKNSIVMMDIKIEKREESYNYYIVSSNEKVGESNCIYEGNKIECEEYLNNNVKFYSNKYLESRSFINPLYEEIKHNLYGMTVAI